MSTQQQNIVKATPFYSSKGRVRRGTYLLQLTIALLLCVLFSLLVAMISSNTGKLAYALYALSILFYFYARFSIVIKRLHDLGKSGWLSLILLVPLINIGFGLWLLFAEGNKQENNYGKVTDKSDILALVLTLVIGSILITFLIIFAFVTKLATHVEKGGLDSAYYEMKDLQYMADQYLANSEFVDNSNAFEEYFGLPYSLNFETGVVASFNKEDQGWGTLIATLSEDRGMFAGIELLMERNEYGQWRCFVIPLDLETFDEVYLPEGCIAVKRSIN